jgi:hypothetical protein
VRTITNSLGSNQYADGYFQAGHHFVAAPEQSKYTTPIQLQPMDPTKLQELYVFFALAAPVTAVIQRGPLHAAARYRLYSRRRFVVAAEQRDPSNATPAGLRPYHEVTRSRLGKPRGRKLSA